MHSPACCASSPVPRLPLCWLPVPAARLPCLRPHPRPCSSQRALRAAPGAASAGHVWPHAGRLPPVLLLSLFPRRTDHCTHTQCCALMLGPQQLLSEEWGPEGSVRSGTLHVLNTLSSRVRGTCKTYHGDRVNMGGRAVPQLTRGSRHRTSASRGLSASAAAVTPGCPDSHHTHSGTFWNQSSASGESVG